MARAIPMRSKVNGEVLSFLRKKAQDAVLADPTLADLYYDKLGKEAA